jgi:hypothetical protein
MPFVVPYGGWVVPDNLLDRLQREVYICTAVTVDALAYECPVSKKQIKVAIIGDPTHTGPQLNDGAISNMPGTLTCCTHWTPSTVPHAAHAHILCRGCVQ